MTTTTTTKSDAHADARTERDHARAALAAAQAGTATARTAKESILARIADGHDASHKTLGDRVHAVELAELVESAAEVRVKRAEAAVNAAVTAAVTEALLSDPLLNGEDRRAAQDAAGAAAREILADLAAHVEEVNAGILDAAAAAKDAGLPEVEKFDVNPATAARVPVPAGTGTNWNRTASHPVQTVRAIPGRFGDGLWTETGGHVYSVTKVEREALLMLLDALGIHILPLIDAFEDRDGLKPLERHIPGILMPRN